jgi:hypothetical protein
MAGVLRDPPSRIGIDAARELSHLLSRTVPGASESIERAWAARGGALPRGMRPSAGGGADEVDVVDPSGGILFGCARAAGARAAGGSDLCLRLEDRAVSDVFGRDVAEALAAVREGPSHQRKRA